MLYYYTIHVLMRDEKEGGRSKQDQTNNKAKQHSTHKAITFLKENELLPGTHNTTLQTVYIHCRLSVYM